MDYERLLLAYKLSKEFVENRNDGKYFCTQLLTNEDKVPEIFAKTSRFEDPVIECVCEWLFNERENRSITKIITEVNICLEKIGRGLEIAQDDLKHSFTDTEVEYDHPSIPFEIKDRKKIYRYLSGKISVWNIRYFAHLLIPYNEVNKIYVDNVGKIEGVMPSVLKKWEKESPSWHQLKSVLNFLNMEHLVKDITDRVHMDDERSKDATSQNFMLFKNCNGNLVVQIEDSSFNWSIQSVNMISKQLYVKIDYIVEKKEGKLMLLIHSQIKDSITDLSITLVDNESKIQLIKIQDIAVRCSHQCTINHLNIITHNSGVVSKQIESIVNTPIEEVDVEFLCAGKLNIMKTAEYEEVENNYIHEYFTCGEKCMEEPLQFPSPLLEETCSFFARRIKDVFVKSQHSIFTVFTHYNSKEQIVFLKLDKKFPVTSTSDDNRILLVLMGTIINIRYTNTTCAISIQNEFKRGEENLRELYIINRKYLKNWTIINVVAAPNFEDTKNINICVDCEFLSMKTCSTDETIQQFFSNVLENSKVQNNQFDNKEIYINIVSKIMCFMATRKALYSVPSLSHNIHKKISSLLLTPQQLRILFHKAEKKIITGPLGSGKTVLALSHLELAYHLSETKSVIYYIIWEDKTILKQDVASHANQNFSNKANVKIVVRDVVELAKDLKMSKVPTPSQLLKLLVENHVNETLHVIIDEMNGEVFDIEESSSLKQYFRTEMQNSLVTIFPQSIEKHKTFISHENSSNHDKYKYKETGMKVFKLDRAMRNSKRIFDFLKAFEQKAAEEKTVIKLPVREQSSNAVMLPENNYIRDISRQPQQQEQVEMEHQQVVTHTTASIVHQKDESFEGPVDADIIAASINDEDLSEDIRTDIKLIFNTANKIGHNIEGSKPLLIHPATHTTTEEEFILMLRIALKDIGANTKRLFIYNTIVNSQHQMTIFYRLLKLLKIEFFHCDDSTNWKILTSDNAIVEDLSNHANYNLLTTTQGARGIEAAECICIINKDDSKLKYLTLEGMSRATQSLILVSDSHISNTNTLMSSTGRIVNELTSEYLIECCVEHSDDSETEKLSTKTSCDNKVRFSIHTQSWQYEEMLEELKDIKCPSIMSEIPNAKEIIYKNLHPPEIVKNIICSYVSDTSCQLSWKMEGYQYTVEKQDSGNLDWKIVASNITSNKFVLNDMMVGELYKFCVVASNQVGKSDDNIVPYLHKLSSTSDITFKDIFDSLINNDIDDMKRFLSIHPNIVHMRGEDDFTPLMWTVWNTNNTSMVEILISHGSDVWAENTWKHNSYHWAAIHGRHTILDILCRHDVTNINRVDVNNSTPLHHAAAYGFISCVDVLLRHENIDVTIKDDRGRTAYDWAGWKNEQNGEIIRRKIKEYEARKK